MHVAWRYIELRKIHAWGNLRVPAILPRRPLVGVMELLLTQVSRCKGGGMRPVADENSA